MKALTHLQQNALICVLHHHHHRRCRRSRGQCRRRRRRLLHSLPCALAGDAVDHDQDVSDIQGEAGLGRGAPADAQEGRRALAAADAQGGLVDRGGGGGH
eukprot:6199813-Pleurochrysis_carterae.AAC.1